MCSSTKQYVDEVNSMCGSSIFFQTECERREGSKV